MSNDASGTQPAWTAKNYDPNQIASFASTESAKSKFTPEQIKMLYGAYGGVQGGNGLGVLDNKSGKYLDINLVNEFETWMKSNQQTQQNWQNYANAVNANNGGEGDNTITTGAAVSQRNQLLGALANPNATTPTPGLGSFGSVMGAGAKS
jgi:hypothetical protein